MGEGRDEDEVRGRMEGMRRMGVRRVGRVGRRMRKMGMRRMG